MSNQAAAVLPAPPPGAARVAAELGVTVETLPQLSANLLARAIRKVELTLAEEAAFERWLPRPGAADPVTAPSADTTLSADGTRKAKWCLAGGAPHRNEFERAATPHFKNVPADLSFGNTMVLTDPGMAIICMARGSDAESFRTALRLFMQPLVARAAVADASWLESHFTTPLYQLHLQMKTLLSGMDELSSRASYEKFVTVADPSIRQTYQVWTDLFKKRKRLGLEVGLAFSEENPQFGAWLVAPMKEYAASKPEERERGPGRGDRRGGNRGTSTTREARDTPTATCFRCGASGHKSFECSVTADEAKKSLEDAKRKDPAKFKRRRV